MEWISAHKDSLLVFASFLGAASALVAAWTVAGAQKKNRRTVIRERAVGEFRTAMAEFLALADRALSPSGHPQSLAQEERRWEDILSFFKADNTIELLIIDSDQQLLEEFRDAIQDMKFAYSQAKNEFESRAKVISLSKRVVREQLKLAREGK